MTVGELKRWCEEQGVEDGTTIRVHAFGGIGGHPTIVQASVGFDWNNGSIVLHTKHTLQYQPKKEKAR